MNNLLIKVFTIASILLCTACSTNSSTATFKPVTAKADQAVIYIYRPSVMSNALYSPGINVDGEFKLYAKNGINSQLILTPGEHTFEFQADKSYSHLVPVTLSLDSGSTTYLRVDTSLKVENSVGYEPYARSFALTHTDEEVAIKEITECCTAKPEQLEDKSKTEAIEEPDDGFSVDKTQNPFSH